MADQSKLEQMLEKLVNNDRDGAESLFHEFVIEKSRGIYENMLEDDLKDLEVDEASHKKDEKKKKDDVERSRIDFMKTIQGDLEFRSRLSAGQIMDSKSHLTMTQVSS